MNRSLQKTKKHSETEKAIDDLYVAMCDEKINDLTEYVNKAKIKIIEQIHFFKKQMSTIELNSIGIIGKKYTKLKNEPEKMQFETLIKVYGDMQQFLRNKKK